MIKKILDDYKNRSSDLNKITIPFSELVLLLIVISSIITSIYFYFVTDDKYATLFIGLWAPTVMSFINYINLKFRQ